MAISVFELFKLGIGPSSSHTMGPMLAARRVAAALPGDVVNIQIVLFGSLAFTGRGHATDLALLQGLMGRGPDDVETVHEGLESNADTLDLTLPNGAAITFSRSRDLVWRRQRHPVHANTMTFIATRADGAEIQRTFYSIGGGALVEEGEAAAIDRPTATSPYPFASGADLLAIAERTGLSIAEIAAANERALFPEVPLEDRLDAIAAAMFACIDRGLSATGYLPGRLLVPRRAAALRARLDAAEPGRDPLIALDWVNAWAIAVNEENAAGARVVTAPTNGAAGVIPAVLKHFAQSYGGSSAALRSFLLTAAAIGSLYKRNASISGAEVGCQGEVGVACSMAAAGLTAARGGTPAQVENAAEIAMEHNLGLTCDPIAGLVQIPCIERNALGAVKAIDASRLALMGDGSHAVSLDKVIATMMRTGLDMNAIYKETSLGGLAVNHPEC